MASQLGVPDLRIVRSDRVTQLTNPQQNHRDSQSCAIEINNATLRYPLGPHVSGSLKSSLMSFFGHRETKRTVQYIDALRDITVSVSLGERVGIVGRNGSGKSTLLRMLAGIYPVEQGSVRVVGQLGTLLELGLGFEVEATGRENIYYRGVAMGYSPAKLREVEQQVVDFADLGEFIDLPMRTYSAGMGVRLGFAISTQLSPDVLLIDEIFGAGDAIFQERALVRIMDVVRRAGIMMLATHDLELVERLCTRVIWLDRGRLVQDGPTSVVLPQFQAFMRGEVQLAEWTP